MPAASSQTIGGYGRYAAGNWCSHVDWLAQNPVTGVEGFSPTIKAIHTIANTRMRSDLHTQAYLARRHTEGKSDREIRRYIKRYITRQLYHALTTAMNPNTASA